jgi:hypothetical protein
MSTPLIFSFFVVSALAMILFLVITARAIQRREVRRLGVAYAKQPAMFVAVCSSYVMFVVIFLIVAIVFAKDLIGKL